MSKFKQKPEKTNEQYRRDIFTLKTQLKDQQNRLIELKQKYQNAQVFGDTSYTYSMKLKILQYTLNDIRAKIKKFVGEQQYQYYCLNFATLALLKSCQVVGLSRQMIFRGVDVQGKGQVGSFQFSSFLREVMRLDAQFIGPLMKVLCPDESKPVTKQRYDHFLTCFMIRSEQQAKDTNNLEEIVMRVSRELARRNISPQKIWSVKEVNVAMVIYGLVNSVKSLDVLDCVACYCRCDPLKSGLINTSALVNLLKQRIDDSINYEPGAVKFKLSKY